MQPCEGFYANMRAMARNKSDPMDADTWADTNEAENAEIQNQLNILRKAATFIPLGRPSLPTSQ